MSEHLSDETLFAAVDHPDAAVIAHVAACAPCRVRFDRLRAGASLLSAARADRTPVVQWSAIDARILSAAESTAADIRRGRLRPARAWSTTVAAGLTLAAAAAGLIALRVAGSGQVPVATAVTQPSQPARPYAVHGVDPNVAPSAPLTGVVLMVAAPVEYIAPGGASNPLEMTTSLHEGARIRTREGGRAVVAMQPGARLDARGGADVRLARFSSTEVMLELAKGEARVDGPMTTGSDRRTSLIASGWTVESKGGAFIAKIEGESLRLRVVSGKVGVSQGGGASRDAFAGDEILLAKNGAGFEVVSHTAQDADEIDTSALSSDGRIFTLPALPGVTSIRVGEHGVLPGNVGALRVGVPVALTAEANGESWTLDLAPAFPAPAAWGHGVRVANNGASSVRNSIVAAARAARVGSTNVESPVNPPAVAPQPAPSIATTAAPAEQPETEVTSAGDREADRAAASRALSVRSGACFRECEAAGSCGDTSGYVALDTESDGTVSSVRVHGFSSASLAACVQREAQHLRLPRTLRSQPVQLDVTHR